MVDQVQDCRRCGSGLPADRDVYYRDVTDTDRGDWVQEGYEKVCAECETDFHAEALQGARLW